MIKIVTVAMLALCLSACTGAGAGQSQAASEKNTFAAAPVNADADSLYAFVEMQTALGPRVPGTPAHAQAVDLLTARLRDYGVDDVQVVGNEATTFDGARLLVRNIQGRINPSAARRILLLAHYDSRPWADHDPDPERRSRPVDGANDGASGVAVILEVARLAARSLPDTLGVDLLLTDLEDWGDPDGGNEDSWAIGARQWAESLATSAAPLPRLGILLDMVGGRNARFHREYFSQRLAPEATNLVWSVAARSGLADRFPNSPGGAITDDHLPMIEAGIPTVDIVESLNPETGSFNPTWHTGADNLENIDPATLRDVAQVVLNTIYNLPQ